MRRITILLFGVVSAIVSHAEMIYVSVNTTDDARSGNVTLTDALSKLEAKTFVALTPAKVFQLTGKSLTFGQKISLMMTQMRVKKQLKKGKKVNMLALSREVPSGISILWLFIGMLVFPPVGLLIALATRKDKEDNRLKSALIGTGIIFIIFLIVAAGGGLSW